MPSFTPLKGNKNGYTFQFVNRDAGGTKYILTAPDGSSTLANCFSPSEINELTSHPETFWKKYVNTTKNA